ncbi:MAG: hypothetical protein DI543_25040, partial [Bradyrhizobium icense]
MTSNEGLRPDTITAAAEVLRLLGDQVSFALIRKQDAPVIDVLLGEVHDVGSLADIPVRNDGQEGPDVLAVVPFNQVAERGFMAHDDGTPLSCLVVERRLQVAVDDFITACPTFDLTLSDMSYDLDDDAYADVVRRIVEEEIGRGEGANFVVRRSLRAQVSHWTPRQGLGVFRNLLL